MKSICRKSLAMATLSALFFMNSAAFAEDIKVSGGGSAMSTIFLPIEPHFEKATGITLTNLPSSSKNGLLNLASGKVDVAVAAVSLEEMLDGAAKDGVVIDPATLVKQQVGTAKTMIFVHPSNKVGKLSKDQLKGIFTGAITNWKEVGGDDLDILVIWGKGTQGQNAHFSKDTLDGAPVTKDALESTNYAKIKETVSATPEGIGIDPAGLADDSVKVFESAPPMTSPIIAVTVGKPSAKVQRLLDYLNGDGRKFTKQ